MAQTASRKSRRLPGKFGQALSQWLHSVVEFPLPDEALRERLWRAIPPAISLGNAVKFSFLTHQFPLSGGDIRNVPRARERQDRAMKTKTKSPEKIDKPEVERRHRRPKTRQSGKTPQIANGSLDIPAAAGNLPMQRLLRSGAISQPEEEYEQEADRWRTR